MTRGIDPLKDHVIICGFGRIGQILAEDLARRGVPFLVVDMEASGVQHPCGPRYRRWPAVVATAATGTFARLFHWIGDIS